MFKILSQVLTFSLLVFPVLGDPDICKGLCGRRLTKTDDTAVANLKANCAKEDYELSLHVDNHITLVATPLPQQAEPNAACQQTIVFHDLLEGKVAAALLPEEEDSVLEKSSLLPLGKYAMEEILMAHDGAKTMAGAGGVWDIVTNNCGTYALSFVKSLGIEPQEDDYIVEYVVEHLPSIGSSSTLAKLKASPNVKMILLKGLGVEDHNDTMLLRRLANFYIRTHA